MNHKATRTRTPVSQRPAHGSQGSKTLNRVKSKARLSMCQSHTTRIAVKNCFGVDPEIWKSRSELAHQPLGAAAIRRSHEMNH